MIFSAYSSMSGLDGASIEVVSLENRRRKTLVRGGTWGRYVSSGHLLYISKGTLFAVPFDQNKLEVKGTPTAVLMRSPTAKHGGPPRSISRGTACSSIGTAGRGVGW